MATIVLAAAGGALGASATGGVLGLSTAVVGRAVGATVGRMVDSAVLGNVLGGGSQPVEHGRMDRLRLTSAGEGTAIAQLYGQMRLPAHVIWSSPFQEHATETEQEIGGGGGAGKGTAPSAAAVTTREYTYTISLALGLCEGPIARVGRVWADGQEIDRHKLDLRTYRGTGDQLPDPLIEAEQGTGRVPAFRGLAYVVIENLDLTPYGNRVPQFSFEVIRNHWPGDRRDLAQHVPGVALIPGTGEYALATTPVRYEDEPGVSRYANAHSRIASTDFSAALAIQTGELRRCGATSLVVSWFGGDLRCAECRVEPKIEDSRSDGVEMPWRSGGIDRGSAREVPRIDGHPVYGGTPADQSVVEAIRALSGAGQDVMFYPFILMDQLADSDLPDPYGGASQLPLPWRGRITTSRAPGVPGSPDGTGTADDEVAAFMGAARPQDFTVRWSDRGPDGRHLRSEQVVIDYTGPAEWSYRRFILHYAHLCAAAGGLESFCVGSELRGLTWIRGARGFPVVEALRDLARDVRGILGPNVKVSYAADWSEYFGYHPADGSGDVYFHLDRLWADRDIDFVGIDNYMPLSDWRERADEADAAWKSVHNLDYLKANILGGEGYDWFYPDREARDRQNRVAITDGHGSPWVYRYKDIRSWWSEHHVERRSGVPEGQPTEWVPQSKPIRFTELGCAAIDKGTNQPNKFLDPKSSESARPFYSTGQRDDHIQVQYLRAHSEFWSEAENNPASSVYGGPMLDMAHAYVWTWDARPYPQFPGLSSVWSDGPNHYRGHWLSGRTGSRTLASVVQEICHRSGVTEIDVEGLEGVVRGYAVAEVTDARSALQPLILAHGFDVVERNGTLVFRMRKGQVDGAVRSEEVVQNPEQSGDVLTIRAPEADCRDRVSVGYFGLDENFEAATSEAVFPQGRSDVIARTELPLVLLEEEGRRIAERWLAESRVAQDRIRFGLPPSRLGIGAGDVVEAHGGFYRVDRSEQAEFQQIEAVRIEPGIYGQSDVVIDPEASGVTGDFTDPSPAGPPLTVFLDLPSLTGEEGDATPWVAASARPWPASGVAVYSSVTGDGYRLNTLLPTASRLGTTETELEAGPVGIWDRGAALRVRLMSGACASVADEAILAGANALAIGSGTDDQWEIIQFRNATLVGNRTWDLTMRLRGQLGTDGVMPPRWPVGSRVVILDRSLRRLDQQASLRGVARHFRHGPAGDPYTAPSYADETRTFQGVGLRPYAPVHLNQRMEGDDLLVSWIRRTRTMGDAWEGLDVPLGEERELYRVRILRAGQVVREEMTSEPRWRYAAAARAEDGTGPATLDVAQVSLTFGPGPTRRLDLMVA